MVSEDRARSLQPSLYTVPVPLDRMSCERRVYRLAVLLTGDRVAAARVIEEVVGAQPDLRSLDGAHLDRLTILRSREVRSSALRDETLPAAIGDALATVAAQQREAWVLTRVYQLGPRELARAMDCSVTASARHLEQADRALVEALGARTDEAAVLLLKLSHALDVPEFYRARMASGRRRRIVLVGVLVMVIVAALTAILLSVLRAGVDGSVG